MYHHGFAMLGLSEVYGVLDESDLWDSESMEGRSIADALTLGVGCAAAAQKRNKWAGWRYSPTTNSADTSVSGAVLVGLLAARNAGIKVPDDCMDKALDYFKKMTSKRGDVGYSNPGGGSPNLQAIATTVYAIGRRKESAEYKAVKDRAIGNIEMPAAGYPYYFRYYMAQALFQADFDAWGKWNRKTIRELKAMQSEDGSFNSGHGKPYATSMSMLALALNYRFLPIYER